MAMTTHRVAFKRSKGKKADGFKNKYKSSFKTRGSNRLFTGNTTEQIEKKAVNVNSTTSAPLTSSFATAINLLPITLGSSPTANRVGRKIQLRSIGLRYTVSPVAGSNPSQARFVIVYDKATNGSTPIAADVFDINAFNSPLNLNNSERFVVIMDEISDSCQSNSLNMSGSRFRKVRLDTVFGGNAGSVADINSGGLFMFIANNSDPTVGVASNVYSYARVRYTDA